MFFAIIPFRQGSTRFPGKFLELISSDGMTAPMWWWVYKACLDSEFVDAVCTTFPQGDLDILKSVGQYKAPCVGSYANPDHVCGTDRVYEAAMRLGIERGVVINAQADEPMLRPQHLFQLTKMFDNPQVDVATLVYKSGRGDRDNVKVKFDGTGRIFSFVRDSGDDPYSSCYTQIGLMGFRLGALADFVAHGPSEREMEHKVELFRCLDNKMDVHCTIAPKIMAVDRPDHLDRVREKMAN